MFPQGDENISYCICSVNYKPDRVQENRDRHRTAPYIKGDGCMYNEYNPDSSHDSNDNYNTEYDNFYKSDNIEIYHRSNLQKYYENETECYNL